MKLFLVTGLIWTNLVNTKIQFSLDVSNLGQWNTNLHFLMESAILKLGIQNPDISLNWILFRRNILSYFTTSFAHILYVCMYIYAFARLYIWLGIWIFRIVGFNTNSLLSQAGQLLVIIINSCIRVRRLQSVEIFLRDSWEMLHH